LGVGRDDVSEGHPPDFFVVLRHLGVACDTLRRQSGLTAVLVGGAAVELYTGGLYRTGDFDVHVSDAPAFWAALKTAGFVREDQPGHLQNFWYLPAAPQYGVQLVSGELFDGRCDRLRLQLLKTETGSAIALPPVEDLIADRLGQHAVASPTDDSMLEQAKLLVSLAESLDLAYLERRVRQEGGDLSLLALK
jgi:hypothetical protein